MNKEEVEQTRRLLVEVNSAWNTTDDGILARAMIAYIEATTQWGTLELEYAKTTSGCILGFTSAQLRSQEIGLGLCKPLTRALRTYVPDSFENEQMDLWYQLMDIYTYNFLVHFNVTMEDLTEKTWKLLSNQALERIVYHG